MKCVFDTKTPILNESLTDVYTTTNKALIGSDVLEDHEAFYSYYKHGPLARTILGQQQVQGVDYAYTLQGWLKGVNAMALDTAVDMGRDGGGTITARDAYGFQLNYFTGDYKPVNTVRNPFPGHSAYIGAAYRPLYNGNISSMGVNIGQLNQPQLYNYEYDQLNRLVSMQAYRNFDQPGNSWSGISATTDHQEAITYDGNGNIVSYLRNGNSSAGKPLAMDNLGYHYNKDAGGNLLNNKLRYVTDGVTATANYTEDIDGQVTDNYKYDQIGNLTRDVSEQIDSIEWNVYGKISRIWKSVNAATGALQQIAYRYDPSGNRISKTVYSNQDASNYKAVHTWYVRDASGNVMATYTSEDVAAKSTLATGTLGKLYLSELHMYGSSRLGIWSRKVDMDVVPATGGAAPLLGTTGIDTFNRGNKFFELANHLGNVLVTVSDRKVGQNPVNGLYTSYTAEVVSASDYAPFGMQMVGRTFSTGSYRYGFNGKENDNEVKGEGNQQDYGMRIYDPTLGKFLSVDPLTKSFAMLSPYQFANNSPVANIDLDGEEAKYFNIVVTEVFDGKGKLFSSNATITEDKSREAGWFVNGAFYRPEGELGSGSSLSFTHVTIRPGENGVELMQIKDNGTLYIPSSDDKKGRGGLYFTSSSGSPTHASGLLKGNDAIPINLDLLVSAVGGFPGGNTSANMLPWEGSGNEVQKLVALKEILTGDKKIAEKIDKTLESIKGIIGADGAGQKVGETVDAYLKSKENKDKTNQSNSSIDPVFRKKGAVVYNRRDGIKTLILDEKGTGQVSNANATDTFPKKN